MKNTQSTGTKILPLLVIAGVMAALSAPPAVAQTAKKLNCNGCVKSKQIKNSGVKSKDIKDGQVKNADLSNNAVNGENIADGAVGNADLADDSVDGAKVQDNSIASTDLSNEAGASGAGGDQFLALSSTAATVRSTVLSAPSDGLVIVNASGTFSLSSASEARCSITTGTALDTNALFRASAVTAERDAWGATRIFNQSAGSETYNLVCDVFSGSAFIEDTQLNAIFVPTSL